MCKARVVDSADSDALHSKHSFTGGVSTLLGGLAGVKTKVGHWSVRKPLNILKANDKPFQTNFHVCDSVKNMGIQMS